MNIILNSSCPHLVGIIGMLIHCTFGTITTPNISYRMTNLHYFVGGNGNTACVHPYKGPVGLTSHLISYFTQQNQTLQGCTRRSAIAGCYTHLLRHNTTTLFIHCNPMQQRSILFTFSMYKHRSFS